MTTFKNREKGFEAKFSHDQEIDFKVTSRRNKLLGLWAAEQLGLEGSAVEHYATEFTVRWNKWRLSKLYI